MITLEDALGIDTTSLPLLPHPPTTAEMEERRLERAFVCRAPDCQTIATTTLVADTAEGPRWLDLCWPHYDKLLKLAWRYTDYSDLYK